MRENIFKKRITVRTTYRKKYVVEINIYTTDKEQRSFVDPDKIIPAGAPILSISAAEYNGRWLQSCGQIFAEIQADLENIRGGAAKIDQVAKLLSCWESCHLNDLKVGTKKQEAALKTAFGSAVIEYEEACEYLKSVNLYTDRGYEYGTAWLYEEIPTEELVDFFNSL